MLRRDIWFTCLLQVLAESMALFSTYSISFVIRFINKEKGATSDDYREGGLILLLFGGT